MRAEEYLKHWEKIKGWTHYTWPKHRRRFTQISVRLAGDSCIDVGCGLGHSTKILAGLYKAKWTGLEFSESVVERARKIFPKIPFICAESYDLATICGREYDSVVCSEVIEHVEDDRSFIKEVIKIANIRAVFTTPNRIIDDPGHLRLYTEEMLGDLFAGYKHAVKSVGGYFYIGVAK